MSVLFSYQKEQLENFRGTDSRSEQTNVVQPWGLVAKNVEYGPGLVKTRPGTYSKSDANVVSPNSLISWYNPAANKSYLAWVRPGAQALYTAPYDGASTTYSIGVTFGYYGALAPYGDKLYLSLVDINMNAAEGFSYVIPTDALPGPYQAARGPLSTAQFSISQVATPVASGMTAGTRYYAVRFITKSGYITRPGPLQAGIYGKTYSTVDLAYFLSANAANDSIVITLTPATTWPADIVGAVLLVTTTNNLARLLYAPVANAAITPGSATPVSFTALAVADGVLAQQSDALDAEQLWSRDVVANPPFHPRYMFAAGDRMVYLLGKSNNIPGPGIVISEPGSPETFSLDFHLRALPSNLEPITGFYYQGGIYILGHNFTYVFTDTGGYPVTWPNPRLVSGSIGTSVFGGISVDPSGNCLVAHQSGFYLFQGGQYATLPISYYQEAEWSDIIWAKAGTPQPFGIVEDRANQRIYVCCHTNTNGYCLYVWDYIEGITPDRVKFSIWTFPTGYDPTSITLVQNFGDAVSSLIRNHLWIATPAGKFLLQKELGNANPYTDDGNIIDSRYRGPYLPFDSPYLVNYHAGLEVRVLGSGILTPRAYGYDDVRSQVLSPITLSTSPGLAYTRLMDLRNEGCSVEFRSGSGQGSVAGDYFQISGWDQYWTGSTKHR